MDTADTNQQPVLIDIVGGFLGAGKTSFINKLLADGLAAQRIALVENEFGQEAIDDKVLEAPEIDMHTLPSGCICCTLKADFVTCISRIVEEVNPNRILIEPTGLASPDELVATCTMPMVADRLSRPVRIASATSIVDVQDATEMIDYEMPAYLNQLEQARFIVLSHIQQANPEELAEAKEAIERVATRALGIVDAPWGQLDGLEVLALSEQAYALSLEHQQPDHHADSRAHGHAHRHGHAGFSSVVLHPEAVFDHNLAQRLDANLRDQGVLRAKGFLHGPEGMVHYEFVNGRSSLADTSYTDVPKLVAIGRDFDAGRLLP